MKILPAKSIKELDQKTIERQGITSDQLMDRAVSTLMDWLRSKYYNELHNGKTYVICGTGNNGGDGLVATRRLIQLGTDAIACIAPINKRPSDDFQINKERLENKFPNAIHTIEDGWTLETTEKDFIIDALFGSGLNRPIEGKWAELVHEINQQPATRISIDIPSGLFTDRPSKGAIVKADATLSFELPKLAFLFSENQEYVGNWEVESIRLNKEYIEAAETNNYYLTKDYIQSIIKNRQPHSHKGTFGHALIVAGSYGKMGAAILCAKAALRSGAGLVTIHAPKCGYEILQISLPEAMVLVDPHEFHISTIENTQQFSTVGIGSGIGTAAQTEAAVLELLENALQPLVLDADALNIIAKNPDWFSKIPKNSILTPHPKEFERLFGKTNNNFDEHDLLRKKAEQLQLYIILKGRYTQIATPEGICFFNSTGNPGMATAGSGDTLTGILTGLLAQHYSARDACLLGVYMHGLAGDHAKNAKSAEALIASDIIAFLGKAFRDVKQET